MEFFQISAYFGIIMNYKIRLAVRNVKKSSGQETGFENRGSLKMSKGFAKKGISFIKKIRSIMEF